MAEKETAKKKKKKHGDRWDGEVLRDIDGMHMIMPILYPNRCDNEAFIQETADITRLEEYIKEYNEKHPEGPKLSLYVFMIAAVLKMITLRPKANRFIVNGRMYQRNYISASYTVKKHFNDDGDERLALIKSEETDTIEDLCKKADEQMKMLRDDNYIDPSSDALETVSKKVPFGLLRAFVNFCRFLDRHGKVPKSFIDTDPYYSSVVLAFFGSIKLHAGYHHLTNWGTCSIFLTIGEKKIRPFYDRRGNLTMRNSIDFTMTIDERLADGYYYSKCLRLFKKLIENPELLEKPLDEDVIY